MNVGILDFLQRETHALDRKLLLLTATSGIANALNLAVINAAVDSMRNGGPSWQHFVWFALSLALFVYSLRYVLYESTRIAENAICSVRIRLADKIRHCDLQSLEAIGETDIHARISRDTAAIAQVARPIFAAAQSAVMIVCTLGYIAIISPLAVVLCIAIIACGGGMYLKDRKKYEEGLQGSLRREDELFESLNGLLKGFKEIRINQAKSADVFADFESCSTGVRDVRTQVMILFSNNIVFIEMFLVVLLGAIVFVLPVLSQSFSPSVTKIVAAILFFFGPLGNVVTIIPLIAQVNVTVSNLRRLESTLDDALSNTPVMTKEAGLDFNGFEVLRLQGLTFTYRDPDGNPSFSVGPINGEIRRGEVVFLVGGNGSGKTTFMKLLTALYLPQGGGIRVDDVQVGPANTQAYRELFSAIFSDFHLFEKLYGLSAVSPDAVNALLRVMDISHKTAFSDGRFTNTHLSTGQRKRLALVVSYLEDKPIYVFDEVAADQDPEFRKYFYETMLADLKKAGKTVIVVTHDDRYFRSADRVLQMDYGTLVAYDDAKKNSKPQRPRTKFPG